MDLERRAVYSIPLDLSVDQGIFAMHRMIVTPAHPEFPASFVGHVRSGHVAAVLDMLGACGDPIALFGFARPEEVVPLLRRAAGLRPVLTCMT